MKKIFLLSLVMMFVLSSIVFSYDLSESIEGLFESIDEMGIKDLIAPFLIVFALIYAVLNYSQVISTQNSINSVIALSFAILFSYFGKAIPFKGISLVEAFNNSILEVLVIILAVIMLYVLIGALGGKAPAFTRSSKGTIIVVILSFLAVGYIFMNSLGLVGNTSLSDFYDAHEKTFAVILPLLIFGLLIYYVTKDNSTTTNGSNKDKKKVGWLEAINKVFGPDGIENQNSTQSKKGTAGSEDTEEH